MEKGTSGCLSNERSGRKFISRTVKDKDENKTGNATEVEAAKSDLYSVQWLESEPGKETFEAKLKHKLEKEQGKEETTERLWLKCK